MKDEQKDPRSLNEKKERAAFRQLTVEDLWLDHGPSCGRRFYNEADTRRQRAALERLLQQLRIPVPEIPDE